MLSEKGEKEKTISPMTLNNPNGEAAIGNKKGDAPSLNLANSSGQEIAILYKNSVCLERVSQRRKTPVWKESLL